MNAHPTFAADKLRSAGRGMSALKAWRKRQLVEDEGGGKRSMRLTDVPDKFGVPMSTWHCWEQLPGEPEFRCPGPANMGRICNEITKGEVSPADFYAAGAARAIDDGG